MNMADAPAPHAAADPTARAPAPALRVRGLGKRVTLPSGQLTILEAVDVEIARGEVVAVVGAAGAGKSRLLSLLAGLGTPSTGTGELGGDPISALEEDATAP